MNMRVAPEGEGWTRAARMSVIGFALARLAMAGTLGLGLDEAYTLVVSRQLAPSYFDHPPLHQWIAHFSALAYGEDVFARLPFVVLFAATGGLMFILTRDLFGARAGAIATFALNVTPFFFASAGSWVVPDGPLLLALAAAALALSRVVFAPGEPERPLALWLAVGIALGLAGLSKYSAVFPALGALAFLAISPRQRRWLARPEPYVAALVAALIVAPVFLWNADHGWVSFRFQGGRGLPDRGGLLPCLAMLAGEFAYLTPWIGAGLALSLAAALRAARRGDDRALFCACLALPAILVFSLIPLWGSRGIPHWPMPGGFFAYPLLGRWLAPRDPRTLRRWASGSAAFLAVLAMLVVSQAATAWIERAVDAPERTPDPTLETLDWSPLRYAPALLRAPDFVVATKWSDAGKIGVALGRRMPLFAFSDDPRGIAFLDDSARFIGRDAVIVTPADRWERTRAALSGYFASFDAPEPFALGRAGRDELPLTLVRAHGLTRAFAMPYPR